MSAPRGTVNMGFRAEFHGPYDKLLPYANSAQHPVPMRANIVHMAVGFGDLGELAASLAESAAAGGSSGSGTGAAMWWVGYDASA